MLQSLAIKTGRLAVVIHSPESLDGNNTDGGGGEGGRERHSCTGVLMTDQQVEWCIDRRSHLQS